MTFKDISDLLIKKFGNETVIKIEAEISQPCVTVVADKIDSVCQFLHETQMLFFDYLACITGIDHGPEANKMEVVYHLNSIPFQHQLVLKVFLDRERPELPTVSHVWKTADWHEREAFDFFGIVFNNHPDLRRILLPDDWQGHPLRKDYQEQEKYHGITVKY